MVAPQAQLLPYKRWIDSSLWTRRHGSNSSWILDSSVDRWSSLEDVVVFFFFVFWRKREFYDLLYLVAYAQS
jgi:hypothetical protein